MEPPSPAGIVPLAATTRPKNLLVGTPDPFTGGSILSPSPGEPRHVADLFREYGGRVGGGGNMRLTEMLRQAVTGELSRLGVEYDFVRSKGKTRKSPRAKDHSSHSHRGGDSRPSSASTANNGLGRTVDVQLEGSTNTTVTIPFIVKQTCDFIRQRIEQQGIFRISGVTSRAQNIMQRFSNPEIEEQFTSTDTVHDAAKVLKQYLRELELPLIPHSIQHVFIQCLELQSEVTRTSALLLAACLVPLENIGCLCYILQFLFQVAQSSAENLMTFENLSIIMGLNIMPIDPRRSDKDKNSKDIQKNERQILDQHNKVVENLIQNAAQVGQISEEVEQRLESLLTLRSSEDELENEGVGRRKKRRSGSLNSKSTNRMLGFLKKVTSGKSGVETPMTPMSHNGDSFSYTPIIKGSARKGEDAGGFSLHKKKNIFDGSRKSKMNGTPKTPSTPLPSQLTCPSPAVCLDPSPMNWNKTTPNGNRLKNFVTPSSLLRKRENKTADNTDKSCQSSTKSTKPRIRFGRSKTVKNKQEIGTPIQSQDSELTRARQNSNSTISIHKLAASPARASSSTMQKNGGGLSVSKIPRIPEKPALPPKRANLSSSSVKFNKNASKSSLHNNGGKSSEGDEYVKISAEAGLHDTDVRNEAFLASSSSISILTATNNTTNNTTNNNSMVGNESSQLNNKNNSTFVIGTDIDANSDDEVTEDSSSVPLEPPPPIMKLQLTPLIQEIDNLTRTAGDLTLSTLRGKSSSSIRNTRSRGHTLPESPTELATTPLSTEQVEQKFIDALKETKILKIQSENKGKLLQQPLQRRLSVQDKKVTMSPSQRRIVSSAARRRRSHEIGRVTPIITPTRFLSLRSPVGVGGRQSVTASPGNNNTNNNGGTLRRSPNRCTLKRGRPNTARVGLSRPSPSRNTPRSVTTPLKMGDSSASGVVNQEKSPPSPPPLPPRKDSISTTTTPLRRMSSVQELVNKLEKNRRNKSKGKLAAAATTTTSSQNLDAQHAVSSSTAAVVVSPENGQLSILTSSELLPPVASTTMDNPTLFATPQTTIVLTRSRSNKSSKQVLKKTPQIFLSIPPSGGNGNDDDEMNWISGQNFKFDRKDFHNLQKKSGGDRDSIHFLKTLRAGKVPATVEYFNQIGHNRSPVKSLIPRYTGLHGTGGESFKGTTIIASTPPPAEGQQNNVDQPQQPTTPSRIARRMSSVDIDIRNRNRKEELLEQIKKESAALKRSNTTASAGSAAAHPRRPNLRPGTDNNSTMRNPTSFGSTNNKRPTTLDLRPRTAPGGISSKSATTTVVSRVPSLRRQLPPINNPQTPRILEEDESLVLSVNRAIDHLLLRPPTEEDKDEENRKKNQGSSNSGKKLGSSSASKIGNTNNNNNITASPLKTSNIANSTLSRKESVKGKNPSSSSCSGLKTSPPLRGGGVDTKKRVTISRTASENGTKSTTICTPRTTPKIKKSLTTRAYDMRMMTGSSTPRRRTPTTTATTPTTTVTAASHHHVTAAGIMLAHSHAHNCHTITPRRRVPRMGNGSSVATPQQQNSENTPSTTSGKSKLRTPLKATHIFTPTPSHI